MINCKYLVSHTKITTELYLKIYAIPSSFQISNSWSVDFQFQQNKYCVEDLLLFSDSLFFCSLSHLSFFCPFVFKPNGLIFLFPTLFNHIKWKYFCINTEIAQSCTWGISIRDMAFSIVIQWSIRSFLTESQWNILYSFKKKCLLYGTAQYLYSLFPPIFQCFNLNT